MASRHLAPAFSNIVVLATALGTMLVGLLTIYASASWTWLLRHPTLQKVTDEIGIAVFVTGLLALLWELRARRALVAEVLSAADLSERIVNAGLIDVTADFLSDIDWRSLFEGTHELDVFFAYGGTWRGNHIERLREVNRRTGGRIRVVLPDPKSADTIAELARRFGYAQQNVIDRINDSIKSFKDLANEPDAKAAIEVWVLAKTPMYSYYRFDDVALIAMYHHKGIRATVPAFKVRRGGSLFAFLDSDVGSMMVGNNAAARMVYRKP